MSYLGADPDRLSILIEFGLYPGEIREFVTSQNSALLLAGQTPRLVPKEHLQAAKWLARLTGKGQQVFVRWLNDQLGEESAADLEELIATFGALEQDSPDFDLDSWHQVCRRALADLYGPSPSPALTEFLRTPLESSQRKKPPPEVDSDSAAAPSQAVPTSQALEAFVRWSRAEVPASEIPDPALRFAAGLTEAARTGDSAILAELPGGASQYPDLVRVLTIQAASSESYAGLSSVRPTLRAFDPDQDYTAFEVIATRKKQGGPANALFLSVEAYVDGNTAYTLESDDLREAYPERGEVFLYLGHNAGPEINRPLAYNVQRTETSGNAKIRVQSVGRDLFLAVYVPSPSTRPDEVRRWLTDYEKRVAERMAIFVLADGLCIKPRAGTLGKMDAADCEWSFDAWRELPALESGNNDYILSPLPSPHQRYECGPISQSVRRLLKRMWETKSVQLSRALVNRIVEQLRTDEEGIDSALRERVNGKLEALSNAEADYESLIHDLMETEIVKRDIEARKHAEVERVSEEITRERNELANVRLARQNVQKSIDDLKVRYDLREKELRGSMRRIFEEARNKEAETLASVGLMDVLRADGYRSRDRRREPAPSVPAMPALIPQRLEPITDPMEDILRSTGFDEESAGLYRAAIEVAVQIGLPILIEGPGASVLGTTLARCSSKAGAIVVDIPVGLVSPDLLKPVLEGRTGEALVLRNANLSDLSAYGLQLLDEVLSRLMTPGATSPAGPLILTASTGPAALTWPTDVEHAALKLNLGASVSDPGKTSNSDEFQPASPLQAKLWARLVARVDGHPQGARLESLLANMLRCARGTPAREEFPRNQG